MLVDKWQTHLKFNGRAPRNLEELAITRADYEHRRRLAEIKAMRPKLAALDAFLPALELRGIHFAHRDFGTNDGGKTVRIPPPICQRDDVLYAALIEMGFREIERRDWGPRDEQVKLKHGRGLVVAIDVTKPLGSVSEILGLRPTGIIVDELADVVASPAADSGDPS